MIRRAIIALAVLCGACGQAGGGADKAGTPSTQKVSQPGPAVGGQKGRFAPRDDCAKLPGARDFRQRMVEAIQTRDPDALAALADPAIKLDFGGGGGVDQLKQQLSSNGDLWTSLDQLVELGCATSEPEKMVIPWLFGQDLGRIDAGAALLVLGEDVPVLSAPRRSAEPVVKISWDFVTAANGVDRKQPFQRVLLPLNKDGWVATDKLRSVLDYRLLASRRTGQWRIEALVRGD